MDSNQRGRDTSNLPSSPDGLLQTMPADPLGRVKFRPGVAGDALLVSVAAIHVFLDTYATEGLRPVLAREAMSVYGATAFQARLNDPDTTFVLAERDEHLLGFAEVSRQRPCPCAGTGFTVELVRLYLLPVAQGRGLGALLLQQTETLLAAEACAGLWLAAWSGNHRALGFYPKLGYRCVGLTDHVIEGVAYKNQVFAKAVADCMRVPPQAL